MTSDLKYWNNGIPILPDSGLVNLKYWLNGETFVYDIGIADFTISILVPDNKASVIACLVSHSSDNLGFLTI